MWVRGDKQMRLYTLGHFTVCFTFVEQFCVLCSVIKERDLGNMADIVHFQANISFPLALANSFSFFSSLTALT